MDDVRCDRWAAGYRNGDAALLRPLVEAMARPLLACAYRYVRDWDTAADLVQEAWLKIIEHIGRYDPSRSFAVWARAVLRNTCLTHLRKITRLPRTALLEVAGDTASERLADDPQHAIELQETAWLLGRALDRLSPTQREVFARVALEREDRATVARDLGLSDGHLRVVLHLARRRLAALLLGPEGKP